MVYVVDDGGEVLTGWSGDNNFLSTSLDVSRSLLLRGVETCALEHYVNVQFAPRKLGSVGLCVDGDFLTVNDDGVFGSFNRVFAFAKLTSETALSRIVLQQVSKHLRTCQVVDGYNFVTFSFEHLTESETANATETINCDFNHRFIKLDVRKFLFQGRKRAFLYLQGKFFLVLRCKITKMFLLLQNERQGKGLTNYNFGQHEGFFPLSEGRFRCPC